MGENLNNLANQAWGPGSTIQYCKYTRIAIGAEEDAYVQV